MSMTRRRWLATAAGLVVGLLVVVALSAVVLSRRTDDAPSAAVTTTPSATSSPLSPGNEIAPVQSSSPSEAPSSGLSAVSPSASPVAPVQVTEAGSATGGLIAGYPRAALAPVPGSTIRSSSVSPSSGRLQVALDASVDAGSDDVLRFYSVRLARRGFVGTPAPAVGGSVATSYRRGASTVVVTVVSSGGAPRSYTVFATLATKKS